VVWDGVPWAVGGGARNSSETARLLVYLASGGQEGIVESADLSVKALETPGTQVRVLSGACVIRNRALGGAGQSYAARNASEDVIDVAPTSSSGPRSDLVIARVENNTISGEPWPVPPSVEDGPYVYSRIISGVPITTKSVAELNLNYSAITLARIDIPSLTGTITQAMIKDLRSVMNVVTGPQPPAGGGGDGCDEQDPVVDCPGGDGDDGDNDDGDACGNTQTTYLNWPFTAAWDLAIPSWANFADLVIEIQNVQVRGGSLGGFLRLILGGIAQAERSWRVDWPGATTRQNLPLTYTNLPIPANIRGTTVHWNLQSRVLSGFGAGKLLSTRSTRIKATIKFKRRPEIEA